MRLLSRKFTAAAAATMLPGILSVGLMSCATNPSGDRPAGTETVPPTPENKAIAFLSREVPRWSEENRCYSCHNNGDAARALYTAMRHKRVTPPEAVADTTAWLSQPNRWDHNGGQGPFSDKVLARLQFAAALVDAARCGRAANGQALTRAAELIVENRRPDGSWQVEPAGTVGSPATWGNTLATYFGVRTLRVVDPRRWRTEIEQSERWLAAVPVRTVPDAAAVLFELADNPKSGSSADVRTRREECVALLKKGQSSDGGWGPFTNSPPEVFDTALALLALAPLSADEEIRGMIRKGRAFLTGAQIEDGSWPETTRPTGAVSYAQRLSTTGWATLALLATRGMTE
jgi:hypothetical protein